MDPNENQPGEASGRTITIQLTRDTIILIAALVFLSLAVLLAIFFPPSSSGNPTPGSTTVAQEGTATTELRVTQVATAAAATSVPDISTLPTSELRNPGEYPAPDAESPATEPTSAVNITPATSAALAPTLTPPGLPTFAPSRPTQASGPTAVGGFTDQTTPYPPPGTGGRTPTIASAVPSTAGQAATPTEDVFEEEEETPTDEPEEETPTDEPVEDSPTPEPTPRPAVTTPQPTVPPPPTTIPVDVIRGTVRWSRGPIFLVRDQQIVPGATLIIDPGVEVRIAPGVSIFVEGKLYARGEPGRPVRFCGLACDAKKDQRWEGLFGRPGSDIGMEQVEIRSGGAGGTVLASEGGNLTLRQAHINENGGHIQVNDSRLELIDSEIAGNDMPYGAALEASYSAGGIVILSNNRIGGNRMSNGAAPVQVTNQSTYDIVNLDVQRNLLVGQDGPNLVLAHTGPFPGGLDVVLPGRGPFEGSMTCNALLNGADGLSIRSEDTQVPMLALTVHDNVIEDHTPPIIPTYLQYGIGRGATSEMALDMRNNWWGDPVGPYEPDRHADGRGEAVGDNIEFAPWLTARPACAPTP